MPATQGQEISCEFINNPIKQRPITNGPDEDQSMKDEAYSQSHPAEHTHSSHRSLHGAREQVLENSIREARRQWGSCIVQKADIKRRDAVCSRVEDIVYRCSGQDSSRWRESTLAGRMGSSMVWDVQTLRIRIGFEVEVGLGGIHNGCECVLLVDLLRALYCGECRIMLPRPGERYAGGCTAGLSTSQECWQSWFSRNDLERRMRRRHTSCRANSFACSDEVVLTWISCASSLMPFAKSASAICRAMLIDPEFL